MAFHTEIRAIITCLANSEGPGVTFDLTHTILSHELTFTSRTNLIRLAHHATFRTTLALYLIRKEVLRAITNATSFM